MKTKYAKLFWGGLFAVIAATIVTDAQIARAGDKEKVEALCPVMGEPVDPSIWTATDDGPVLLCCGGCIKKYNENPEKYAVKTAALREAMKKMPKTQVTCPISGDAVDTDVFTKQDGENVYFCCEKCKGAYEKDPAKYKTKLANSYSYQPGCPFSGDPIDPTASVEFTTGQKVYFCCGKCSGKFASDPAAHVDKLKKLGIYVKPDKLKKG